MDVRHWTVRFAAALAAVAAAVCTGCSAGDRPHAGGGGDGAGTGAQGAGSAVPFAPYVSATTAAATDTAGSPAAYHVAFAVASGRHECTPMWDDGTPIGDADTKRRIAALRESGAEVRVSFGGATGTELAVACERPDELAAAYERVLERTGAASADLDIEGDTLENSAANARRAKAIGSLQRRHEDLEVSFTLPVMPTGLTSGGEKLLRGAADAGVEVSAVNVMAMSYSPSHTGDMGGYAIAAARAAHGRLTDLLGLSGDRAWRALRVTVMIGVNDIERETFTLDDAAQLAAFAAEHRLDGLSMWSSARDRECPGGPRAKVDEACSGVTQDAGAFADALSG